MAVEVTFEVNDNLISVNTEYSRGADIEYVENIYYRIAKEELGVSNVSIITINPQVYSFAQGLGDSLLFKTKNREILINSNFECSPSQLKDIIQSEEFRRGLLLILQADCEDLIPYLDEILEITSDANLKSSQPIKLIFCANDGHSLCLYNTCLGISDIQKLVISSTNFS